MLNSVYSNVIFVRISRVSLVPLEWIVSSVVCGTGHVL